MKTKKVSAKKIMPTKVRQPHIGGAMGKKKGMPTHTKAHTYTEK